MKLIRLLFRSMSRSAVHEEEHYEEVVEEDNKKTTYDDGTAASTSSSSLTVWRKSLLFSCNGFTVIDSIGNLVYRVDSYINGRRSPEEIILMDGLGKPILSVRRHPKKLKRLLENWLVYEGDVGDDFCTIKSSKKPLFCVKKRTCILNVKSSTVLAQVFRETSDKRYAAAYVIEGSYPHRSCKVLDESRKVVAEINRKESMNRVVSFGVEVFVLIVQPGFDRGLAMALVVLLDQMF